MKSAIFVILAAVALTCNAAAPGQPPKLGGPAGECPLVDGKFSTFLPDLTNRDVYYQCSNGSPILLPCSAGLVFNPCNNNCDYPSTTAEPCGPIGNCPLVDGPFPTMLRDGTNLSVLYLCRKGLAVKLTCADGLIFDAADGTCVLP